MMRSMPRVSSRKWSHISKPADSGALAGGLSWSVLTCPSSAECKTESECQGHTRVSPTILFLTHRNSVILDSVMDLFSVKIQRWYSLPSAVQGLFEGALCGLEQGLWSPTACHTHLSNICKGSTFPRLQRYIALIQRTCNFMTESVHFVKKHFSYVLAHQRAAHSHILHRKRQQELPVFDETIMHFWVDVLEILLYFCCEKCSIFHRAPCLEVSNSTDSTKWQTMAKVIYLFHVHGEVLICIFFVRSKLGISRIPFVI